MYKYKFTPYNNEADQEFRDRVQKMCDGKSVLVISFKTNADGIADSAEVQSFDEL